MNMRPETWMRFSYLLTTMERGFMDVKETHDPADRVLLFNEVVSAIEEMVAALRIDILTDGAPEPTTIQ